MKGPMTSSTLPDISRDKLDGFKKMALAVIDDMHEAAVDMASRHDHMVDLLKARVEEQDGAIQKQRAAVRAMHDEAHEACDAIAAVTGIEQDSLPLAVENIVGLVGNLRHRIDEMQKQMSAIAAEALLEDHPFSSSAGAVQPEHLPGCRAVTGLVNRDFCMLCKGREAARSAGAAQLAEVPPQKGPFVVTMKVPGARRFWGPGAQGEAVWVSDLAGAYQFADVATAERRKPRRSAVVSLDDARELIEAEKVVSITPPADAPTGPEAA